MPRLQNFDAVVGPSEDRWALATEAHELGGALVSSPWSMPAFFSGWVGLGVLLGAALGRRGHDGRLMVALGVGLGPLMGIVVADAANRRRAVRQRVLSPGFEHGGDLDVLVLVQERPESVRHLVPTLTAIVGEVRLLTLARAVPYEWLEDDDENEVVDTAASVLVAARRFSPIRLPALVLLPGSPERAAAAFAAQRGRTLVLHAIDEPASTADRP